MTTGEAIVAALAANPAVVALVGAKIFPNVAPQGTVAPWVVYSVISDIPENALTGDASTRIASIRLQVDAYSKTYLGAHAIADAIDQALTQLLPPELAVWREVSRDLYDNEAQLHRVEAEFFVQR